MLNQIRRIARAASFIAISFFAAPSFLAADEDKEVIMDAVADYMLESTHVSGVITQEQFKDEFSKAAVIFDMREAKQYEARHIPGAIHMEWRETIDRIDEIPKERPVVLYCGTGLLSAQAGFTLRVLGYQNVVILRGGFEAWKSSN